MPPRYQSRPTDLLTRVRNEMDALGRPGMAGTSRLGGNRGRGGGRAQQSVLTDLGGQEEAAGQGQMLLLTGTADSIASGGDYVTFDTVVHQYGFTASVGTDGQTFTWPISAVGGATVQLTWDTYDGGGTVELEVDGAVPAWGLIGGGTSGRESNAKTIDVDITAGAQVKLKVTQTSGVAQVCDVTMSLQVQDPTTEPGEPVVVTTCPTMGASSLVYGTSNNQAFPGIVVASNGDIVALWRSGGTHTSTDGVIVKSISSDGGTTWSAPSTVLSSASYDYRGATLTRLTDSTLLATIERRTSAPAETTQGATVIASNDNGATWSTEAVITHSLTAFSRGMQTVELANGDLIATVYGRDTSDATNRRTVVVSKSTDGGANWTSLATVAHGPTDGVDYSEAGITLSGSTLVILIREDVGSDLYVSTSTSGGAVWSSPRLVTSGATGRPTLATRQNGDIVNVYRDTATGQFATLQRSANGGDSWADCHAFNDVGGSSQLRMTYAQALDHPTTGKLLVLHAYERSGMTDSDIYFAKET